jgi:hypothetical protein
VKTLLRNTAGRTAEEIWTEGVIQHKAPMLRSEIKDMLCANDSESRKSLTLLVQIIISVTSYGAAGCTLHAQKCITILPIVTVYHLIP